LSKKEVKIIGLEDETTFLVEAINQWWLIYNKKSKKI
jgi:hypothetical protein